MCQFLFYELVADELRIYSSINYVNTGSYNGLSPARHQVFIWISRGLLLVKDTTSNSVLWIEKS